jgi:hypothetical protein
MSAIPVAAQAPAVTTFDGTYVGVSRTVEKKEGCLQGKPFPDGPLTIAGGVARYPSLAFMPGSPKGRGTFEGRVNGEGKLFMRGADEISAQIDGRGTVTGRTPLTCRQMVCCTYQLVWRKR